VETKRKLRKQNRDLRSSRDHNAGIAADNWDRFQKMYAENQLLRRILRKRGIVEQFVRDSDEPGGFVRVVDHHEHAGAGVLVPGKMVYLDDQPHNAPS
jgi:hypothetical protein